MLIIQFAVSVALGFVLTQPVCPRSRPDDRGQPEQHAVPGGVGSILRALVSDLGDGPPDPADPHPREAPHSPLAAQRVRLQIHAGRAPTAQQESRLNVLGDALRASLSL